MRLLLALVEVCLGLVWRDQHLKGLDVLACTVTVCIVGDTLLDNLDEHADGHELSRLITRLEGTVAHLLEPVALALVLKLPLRLKVELLGIGIELDIAQDGAGLAQCVQVETAAAQDLPVGELPDQLRIELVELVHTLLKRTGGGLLPGAERALLVLAPVLLHVVEHHLQQLQGRDRALQLAVVVSQRLEVLEQD